MLRTFESEQGFHRILSNAQSAVLSVVAVTMLAVCAVCPARADAVANFYRGKIITLVVGGNAGGGYDVYARAIAPRLSAHIPGKPTVVVQDDPGAGSLIAARSLYFTAPKDGTTIGELQRGAVMEPLLGDAASARFDSRKFIYLASASTANGGTCIVRPDAKVQSFKQLFTTQLIVGAAGRGTSIGDMPIYIQNLLKTKMKIVSGYQGSPDALLAFARGEIEGICGLTYSDLALQVPTWLPDGKAKAIVQLGMESNPELDKLHVPMIWKFIRNAEDRRVLQLIFGQLEFGRPFVAPPGTPADRVAALRSAFDETFKDPLFVADVKRLRLDLDPRSGSAVQVLVDKLFAASPADIKRAREVVR